MLDTVPPPLLDRMELISLQGYSEDEKMQIASRFLIPRQIKENGITSEQIEFPPERCGMWWRHYTREAGVRKLEQTLARSAARRLGASSKGIRRNLVVTPAVIQGVSGWHSGGRWKRNR